jgi:hypothetical protein
VSGKRAKGQEGGEQNRIGQGPLENHLRDLIEEVLKDKIERSFVFDEKVHFLKEENDHID